MAWIEYDARLSNSRGGWPTGVPHTSGRPVRAEKAMQQTSPGLERQIQCTYDE